VLGLASSSPTLIEVYRRAIAACNHKIFYPQARILVYNQIERERENKWDYPVTMEQKLVNLVRRGEIGQIQELLRELVPTLVNLSDRSYLVLRTWVEGLVNSLKRMVISEGLLFNGITTPKPDSFWFSVAHLEKELSVWVKSIHTQFTVSIPTEQPLIAQAVNFMLEHYQEDLTLARVAQELKISPGYFSRLFKEEIGTPFKNYLITVRMDKAKQLLLQSTLAVSEVAFAVGYTDPNYFSEAFRKYEGVSPSEYKALNSRP
jgi:two-component system response regulator YesN